MAFGTKNSGGQLAMNNQYSKKNASGDTAKQPVAAGMPQGTGMGNKHMPSKSTGGLKAKIMGQAFGKYHAKPTQYPAKGKVYVPGDIVQGK